MTGRWSDSPAAPATWSHSAALHLNDGRMLSVVDGPELQISWFKRNVFLIIIWCPPFFLHNFIFLRTWATNFECWIAADSLSWKVREAIQIQTPELTSRYLWRFPTIATANLQIHRKWSVFPQLLFPVFRVPLYLFFPGWFLKHNSPAPGIVWSRRCRAASCASSFRRALWMLALLRFPTWSAPSISRCIGGYILRKHHGECMYTRRVGWQSNLLGV